VVFCASAPETSAPTAASAHIKREVNIIRLPRYSSRTEQDRAVPPGTQVMKFEPMMTPNEVSGKDLPRPGFTRRELFGSGQV
jgi:hypothetical protein